LLVPARRRRQIDADAKAVRVQDPETELGRCITLLGRQEIPAPRRLVVGLAAEAPGVHRSGSGLCLGMPLLGGSKAPAQCLGMILQHADAVREHQFEISVGSRLVDLGGSFVPAADLEMRVSAEEIGKAQLVLRLDMALLSGAAIPHDGIAEIAENALALGIEKAETILRFGIAGARELGPLPLRTDVLGARIGRQRRPERPPPSRTGIGSRRSRQGRASRWGRRHRIRRRGGGPFLCRALLWRPLLCRALLWRLLLWRPLLWRIEHF